MVSVESQEFILSIVDYNQEFNAKIILLFIILIYSILMLWWSYRLAPRDVQSSDVALKDLILSIMMKVFSIPWLIMFPLAFTIFVFRGYSLAEFAQLIIGFYMVVFIVSFMYLFIFGWQKLLELFGIKALSGKQRSQIKSRFFKVKRGSLR